MGRETSIDRVRGLLARSLTFLVLGLGGGIAPAARGAERGDNAPHLELHADLQNLFLFRSDSDFDSTPPANDANGQSVGALATVLTPTITLHARRNLRLVYQLELGLNFWSKQNADLRDPLSPEVFLLKHREVYGEGELLDDALGFKVGFGRFRDPTGLFVNHWLGNAQVNLRLNPELRTGLFLGQLPDSTYEGLTVRENNFRHDRFVFGATSDLRLSHRTQLSAALVTLYDAATVGETFWVLAPAVHLESVFDGAVGSLDGILQLGQQGGQARDGGTVGHLAWAAQAHFAQQRRRLTLDWNVLALSPDDGVDGNRANRAFLYSGKSRSATVMLTEDEIRDWYDNFDERMGSSRGGFFLNRAGLLVGDVTLGVPINDWLRPALILGAATTLNPANAFDHWLVGVESDLRVELRYSEQLSTLLLVGALLPGEAGAALLNTRNLSAQRGIWMAEASLLMHY